jgi:hypothetical protein
MIKQIAVKSFDAKSEIHLSKHNKKTTFFPSAFQTGLPDFSFAK